MRIVEQAKAVVGAGTEPAVWKRAKRFVIRKPGKHDYMKLKAYRSISRLSCMGKVDQQLVAELLAKETDRGGLLSDGQYRSSKRRLAIDVAAITGDRAQAAWREGHVTGILLIQIKEAIHSSGSRILIHTIIFLGMNRDLIQYKASCLTDQTVNMVIEGNVMDRRPEDAAIPQCSLVPVIILTIYSSGCLQLVEERDSGAEDLYFMDNVRWVATGIDFNQVVTKLKGCTRASIDWAERRDREFDTAKIEMLL